MDFTTANALYAVIFLFRCVTFNGLMRDYNLHANHLAFIKDIADRFSTVEHLISCTTMEEYQQIQTCGNLKHESL